MLVALQGPFLVPPHVLESIREWLDKMKISPALKTKGEEIWDTWKSLTLGLEDVRQVIEIVLVGKYLEQPDSYCSVVKSLEHAAMRCRRKLVVKYVDAEALEPQAGKTDPAAFHKAWHDV